jgi:FkbM family methyltransferase
MTLSTYAVFKVNFGVIMRFKNAVRKIARNIKISISPQSFFAYSKEIHGHHVLSYAQEGEDRVLARFIGSQEKGFYVDIGAHHPQRFSNTYHFYLNGWSGINVDAMPGSMDEFKRIRPKDINLEMAISDKKESLTYYEFNETALNGFSKELSDERDGLRDYKVVATHQIETHTLTEILDENLPQGQTIDFMSVDVEGLDLQVLKSNNWEKYRPRFVLAESLQTIESIDSLKDSEIYCYMISSGYHLCAKLLCTIIFARNELC